jgi:uroporphyrin-III C-methyltransferase
MAVSSLPAIVSALMEGGLAGSTPALGRARGDDARERVVEATLEALPGLRKMASSAPPPSWRSGAIAAFRSSIANHLLEFGSEAAQ